MARCELESCGKPFQKTRSFMRFCSGECRDRWNHNHYCGHGRKFSECNVSGCEGHALWLLVQVFEKQFKRCGCGVWFQRRTKQPKQVHCSKRCREIAKHEAEKARKRAI
jgi:predicted nucleic acid-binding Zn ribbon protein